MQIYDNLFIQECGFTAIVQLACSLQLTLRERRYKMQIVREKPCQRRHHRVTAPMMVTLPSGEQLRATNWSLGGLRLDAISTALPKIGETMKLDIELPFQGFGISFEVEIKIARVVKETNTIGAAFVELSERATDLMNHFINDLVRGQMATIEDTICRIDVPVTPISTKPDVNPSQEVPIKRWPLKTIIMSIFYIVLGITVFSYLAILLYAGTMKMEISSAVISAPVTTLTMPADGLIMPVKMQENGTVKQGDILARVKSAVLERELTIKKRDYERKSRQKKRLSHRWQIETDRLKIYQSISLTKVKIAKAKVESSKAALSAADANLIRVFNLVEQGLAKNEELEITKNEQRQLESRVKEEQYLLEQAIMLNTVSGRKFYNQEEFVSDLDMLALELDEANSELQLIHTELQDLILLRDEMVVKAPFDGKIIAVKHYGAGLLTKNTALITLEKRQAPSVTAFLTQEEIVSVGLKDAVNIYLPSQDKTYTGFVTKIDRNSSFLNTKSNHYEWKDQGARNAAVSLQIETPNGKLEIDGGTPVIVIFTKRNTSSLFSDFRKIAYRSINQIGVH